MATFDVSAERIVIDYPWVGENCPMQETVGFLKGVTPFRGLPLVLQTHEVKVMYEPDVEGQRLTYRIPHNINRMMLAIHEAYDKHKIIELTPDDFWQAIVLGISVHIKSSPEAFRRALIEFPLFKYTDVSADFKMWGSVSDWENVMKDFCDSVHTDVGENRFNAFHSNFLTSNPNIANSSVIQLLHLLDDFYTYSVTANCHFRSIIINGNVSDWVKLKTRVKVFAAYGLSSWQARLEPIIDKIIATYNGEKDEKFWDCMYQFKNGTAVGWINTLFPFVLDGAGDYIANPAMSGWHLIKRFQIDGVELDKYPSCIFAANFDWNIDGGTKQMQFVSGFMSTVLNPETNVMKPQVGWLIRQKPI